MKETSRKKNALRNSIVGILAKVITLLGGYLTRILLVRAVPPELVGLNGLFFTILGGMMLTMWGWIPQWPIPCSGRWPREIWPGSAPS